MVAKTRHTKNKKRHGHHQHRSRHFLKTYSPYIPLALIVTAGLIFSAYWNPSVRSKVLAHATNMSVSGLLEGTNNERSSNGKTALSLNSKLNQAAQAKANDMVARNYWSHNTPEGNPPWIFIDQTGYNYNKAGENLAYGFMSSSDTVAGWMNSPPHRDNMLDSAFTEVGFGFTNSDDFQGTGPQTIVVAMYAQPATVAAAPSTAVTPAPSSSSSKPASQPAPAPTPEPTPTPTPEPAPTETKEQTQPPVNTEQPTNDEPAPQAVPRFAAYTRGTQPWMASSLSMITVAGLGVLLVKYGLVIRRMLVSSERFILHHTLFDVTVISLLGLVFILTRTAGVIR